MRIELHRIARREDGVIDLAVSMGNGPPEDYTASYDGSDERCKFAGVDHNLFMSLSDLAHRRFGNCAVYQAELMLILRAFNEGDQLPTFPAQLGSTRYCTLRPGTLQIIWNKFTIILQIFGILRRSSKL